MQSTQNKQQTNLLIVIVVLAIVVGCIFGAVVGNRINTHRAVQTAAPVTATAHTQNKTVTPAGSAAKASSASAQSVYNASSHGSPIPPAIVFKRPPPTYLNPNGLPADQIFLPPTNPAVVNNQR